MKQFLLGTRLGGVALTLRDQLRLIRLAISKPEVVGNVLNDILATKIITRICGTKMVFIDIGAHIGSIIYEVERSDRSIEIIGIEAIPEKAKNLDKLFPDVEVFNNALGNTNGKVDFYVNKIESGYSSLIAPREASDNKTRVITVSIKKLDELREFENVDAIKIDVEGAELEVIQGAKETIINNNPIIMFESAPGDNQAKEEIFSVFASLDYGIHLPNRVAHNDASLSIECFLDSHVYPRHTTNYFAIPIQRRIEFRDKARKILNMHSKKTG